MIYMTVKRTIENLIQNTWKIPCDYCDVSRISISYIFWMFLFCEISIRVTVSTNVRDIASTKVKFFGPLPKFQVRRAGNQFRVPSRIRAE